MRKPKKSKIAKYMMCELHIIENYLKLSDAEIIELGFKPIH